MKKYLFLLFSVFVGISALSAQIQNEDFNRGRELFDRQHYSVSREYFEKFLDDSELKNDYRYNPDFDIDAYRLMCQEAEYYIVSCAYKLDDTKVADMLVTYSKKYPYSPMMDRVDFMLGSVFFSKKKYDKTVSYYKKVKIGRLQENEQYEYLYSYGYASLQLKDYAVASKCFAEVYSDFANPYRADAEYYYAYSEFCRNNCIRALEIFVNVSPSSSYYEAAQFHILQIYDRQKQYTKAVELGKQLLDKYPKSQYISEAYRILGENSYFKQNWSDVTLYLQKYAKLTKVQRSDMYMLGIAYYMTKDYKNAISSLGKVTSQSDSLAQNAYVFIGYSYLHDDKADKARMAFQSASFINSDEKLQEESLYNYALATYESDAPFGEMIKAFERFAMEYPNSDHIEAVYEHMADVYISDKNYEGVIESLSKIKARTSKLKKAEEHAYFQLGVKKFNKNDYVGAKDMFLKSIALFDANSYSAQAYLWLGETAFRMGDMMTARENIRSFLASKQQKTQDQLLKAYYTLGYSCFNNEEYASAEQMFSRALAIKEIEKSYLYSDVLNRLGDLYFKSRNFDKAKEMYGRVPENASTADYAIFQTAFILGLQKQYDEKIKRLEYLISRYPSSFFADDALYEIGRTYVLQTKNKEAIETYRKLQKSYPKSSLAVKAALETGMIYANMDNIANAINAYKYVVENYPVSEETRVALESMQALYIDMNQVDEYVAYRESFAGTAISTINRSEEDSISFIAAERAFARQDYEAAISSLDSYIVKFCEVPTLNCITAQYYLAESLYKTKNFERALSCYDRLSSMDGSPYVETALLRASEITYGNKDYNAAKYYFEQLYPAATTNENRAVARLGILRCSYYTGKYEQTVAMASEIIDNPEAESTVLREARYCRAKSYIHLEGNDSVIPAVAVPDLKALSSDLSFESGAEAAYLYADYLFKTKNYSESEAEIVSFIERGTPFQYWIARCFIILSDISVARDNDFMAKQYLLSLQENYSADDDIAAMIAERLSAITERENNQILE